MKRSLLRSALLSFLLAGATLAARADGDPFRVPDLLAENAIVSCGDLSLHGRAVVDSEAVRFGGSPDSQGHVRSNADIDLRGNAIVRGDATAGPDGEVVIAEEAEVTGVVSSAADTFDCEPIDLEALRLELEADNDNDSLPETDLGGSVLGADGVFRLGGHDGITLDAGRYLVSSLEISGTSEIRIAPEAEGSVDILVLGSLAVVDDAVMHQGGSPWALRIWVADGMKITSRAAVTAFFYAPTSEVRISAGGLLRGGVFAGTAEVWGDARVRRVIDDDPPVLVVDGPVDGEEVDVCEVVVHGRATDAQGPVSVRIGGEEVEVAEDGSFSSLVSLFTEEPGTIVVEATDSGGTTVTRVLHLVITPPEVALTQPAPGSLIGTRIVDLAGTAPRATWVTVDGQPAEVADGAFELSGFDLGADGLRTLEIVGRHCAGEATVTPTLDLDTSPPTVGIDSPTDGDLFGVAPITVAGAVDDAHLVEVRIGEVVATIDGDRFVAVGVDLSEGANALVAVATDALGRTTTSAPVAVVLDTTAPTVAIETPTTGSLTASATIDVTGSVSEPHLDRVEVAGPLGPISATVADGRFAASAVALQEGGNELRATATDQLGNSAVSPAVVVVLDTLPPELTIDADPLPGLTAASELTVSGTVTDPHLESVSVLGVEATVSGGTGPGGTWVATIPLAEGDNTIVAAAIDALGHQSVSPTVTVVRDSAPPAVTITSPADGDGLTVRSTSVAGTVADVHLELVRVQTAEGTVEAEVDPDGTWTAADAPLPEGESEIGAVAFDVLGQSGAAVPVTVVVDTLPPLVALASPPVLVGTETVEISGTATDPHLDRVRVRTGGGGEVEATAVSGDPFTVVVSLAEGANEITAVASDTFGHETTSPAVTVVRDATPPAITIDTPAPGALVATPALEVGGTVADPHLDSVTVAVDGGAPVPAPVADDGTGPRFAALVELTEGSNQLVAEAADAVGNSATSAPVAVVLDTLPPEVAIDALPALISEESLVVAGTALDPHLATVELRVASFGGPTTLPASLDGDRWTVAGVTLGDGVHQLVAVATDTLGHVASTAPVTVVRDGAPPAVTLDLPADGALLGERTVTAFGTVADAHLESVTLDAGGAAVGAVVNGDPTAGATWQATAELPEGPSVLGVEAVDTLGQSGAAGPVSVVVDTLPPVLFVDPPGETLVDIATLTLGGTVEEPHLEDVVVAGPGGTVTATVTPIEPGRASWQAEVPLVEGENALAVTATDTLGRATTPPPLTIVLDTLPPELTIEAPTDGEIVTSLAVEVRGTVADPHLESVTVEGSPAAVADGAYLATVPLADGANALLVVAEDRLGHRTERSVTVLLDTLPPVVTIDVPDPGPGACLPGGVPVDLGGRFTDPNPSTGEDGLPPAVAVGVRRSDGGAPVELVGSLSADGASWSLPGVDLGSIDGRATAVVTATDLVGNASTTSRTWLVDATVPTLSFTVDGVAFAGGPGASPAPGTEPHLFPRAVVVSAVVADGPGGAPPTATLTLDGAPYSGAPIAAEGVHVVVARVLDCAGHEAVAHLVVEIDRTAPRLLSTVPAAGGVHSDAPGTFTGLSDPDLATAVVAGRDAAVGGAGPGSFALSPFPWREGENRVPIVLRDRAGHRSEHEVVFTVRTLELGIELRIDGLPIGEGAVFYRPVAPEAVATDPEATVTTTLDGAPFPNGTRIESSGTYTFAGTARDAANTTASDSVGFRVDLEEGPRIRITAPEGGARLAAVQVRVEGTVEGVAPTVTVNDRPAFVDGGTWVLDALTLDPSGLTEIFAVATDAEGRTSMDTVLVLSGDRGPEIVLLEPAPGAVTNRARTDVAGAVIGGPSFTLDGRVQVFPRAETGSGPVVAELAPDGSFRARDVPLLPGENPLRAEVTAPDGELASASVTVFADQSPPTIAFRADGRPLADGAVFASAIDLVIELADDSGVVPDSRIRLNGATVDATGATTTIPIADAGGRVVSVVARDAAGNETRAERSFVLDFGGCILTEVEPATGATVAVPVVTIRGRATSAAGVTVRVPAAGGGYADYPASVADGTFLAGDVPLAVGESVLRLVCENLAGGAQEETLVLHRTAAGDGPAVQITSPGAGALVAGDTVTVAGTTSAPTVTVNGLAAIVTGGSFSVAGVPLTEGPNVLVARASDPAGGLAFDRVVLTRDATAPRIAIVSPDGGTPFGPRPGVETTIPVSGTVDLSTEPHLDRVTVSTAAGSVVATVDPATGDWHADGVPIDTTVPAGEPQDVTAVAVDTLGHEGTTTTNVRFDPDAPAIRLLVPEPLTRYGDGAPATFPIEGEVWAEDGAKVSINGGQLDPATLAWSAPFADGRRHATFALEGAVPAMDGPFGVVASVVELDDSVARHRVVLSRDATPPEVLEIVPADGTAEVDPASLVLVLFSEPVAPASLTGPDGLRLIRDATGATPVGVVGVSGPAVAFAPAAALEAGETYTLEVGAGVRDLHGNALVAPAAAGFTVATRDSGQVPIVDPLPAVVCADVLEVRGVAAPGATLAVRDAGLTFTGFADPDTGEFLVTVPVTGNGWHVLHVVAVDATGAPVSPETTLTVRVDCSAPRVADAVFDRGTGVVGIRFSEAIEPGTPTLHDGTSGSVRVRDAESQETASEAAELVLVADDRLEVRLDPGAEAWWRERPVRLEVGPPIADLEGNTMLAVWERVFFPGGDDGGLAGGFLFGEAWDDATGRPLEGATVRLFPSGSGLPGAVDADQVAAPTASASTEGRGRFTVAGEVPAGRYALVVERTGWTRGLRWLALRPAGGAVPFDVRLTPRGPATTVDPAAGGTVTATAGLPTLVDGETLVLEADPGALPGTAPVDVHLTALGGQGLPDLLPHGWSPVAGAELHLVAAAGTPEAAELPASARFGGAGVRLELPLVAGSGAADLVAARYDPGSGSWVALAPPVPTGTDRVRVDLDRPGAVAVLVADTDPRIAPPLPEAPGTPLAGATLPDTGWPELEASLALDPPVVAPTGRAVARVVARSADGLAPWPSGLAVQAFLEERLILAAGAGELLEAPFSADLVLYRRDLDPGDLGGADPAAAGALEVVVSPSPRAAQVLLETGWETIRLFPFPEEVEREPEIGDTGGGVDTPDGVALEIPEGALPGPIPVGVERLGDGDLLALPAIAGFATTAGVRLDFRGVELARPATLRIPADGVTDDPADPRLILAELVTDPGDGRGAFARLVSRAEVVADRIVASPALDGALDLDGIVREGVFLVLRAEAPIGFATGFVRRSASTALAGARTVAGPLLDPGPLGDGSSALGTGDLARLDGRYAIPVPAGPAGGGATVVAGHPLLGERGEAPATVSAGGVVTVDVVVHPIAPTVLSVEPADGAVDIATATTVSLLFSEPLDPGSVAGTVQVELADAAGQGTGARIAGTTTLSEDGVRVVFRSTWPLPPSRRHLVTFTGTVRDAGGVHSQDGPRTWLFTTGDAVAPGGQVDPSKFHLELPVDGRSRVWAEPGALPLAVAGQPAWIAFTEIEGETNPIRDSIPARPDGSWEGFAGHPPEQPVSIADRVWIRVLDSQGQTAARFRLGPFASPDRKTFVAPAGEAVTFETADGIVVDVPAGAFDAAREVTIELLPLAGFPLPAPAGMALGARVDVRFDGEAAETLRVHVPAPATVGDDATVFVGIDHQLPWGRRLRLLSVGGVLHRDGERFLSNDPSLQPEPDEGGPTLEVTERSGRTLETRALVGTRSCADVLAAGGRCLVGEALIEFTRATEAAFFHDGVATGGVGTGAARNLVDPAWGLAFGVASPLIQIPLAVLELLIQDVFSGFVFVPPAHDWNNAFVLPVVVDAPYEIQRRDVATGWVVDRTSFEAPTHEGLIEVGVLGQPVRRPMLVEASPFELLRFGAPGEGQEISLRLELEARTGPGGLVTLGGNATYPMPALSSVALWDLAPFEDAEDPSTARPVAGPSRTVCADDWSVGPVESSPSLLAVVSAGDLDPEELDVLRFRFDRPLADLPADPTEIVRFEDLGPRPESGCTASGAPGYPTDVPTVAYLEAGAMELVVLPAATLPRGHRFRVELIGDGLRTAGGGPGLAYPQEAPRRFDFATRKTGGASVAEHPEGLDAFGGAGVRDVLQVGNLLFAASETARLLAIDVSAPTPGGELALHSIHNASHIVRGLATDGHGRVFYPALIGSIWAMKGLSVEEARAAEASCVGSPEWALGVPCFDGEQGSARMAFLGLGSSSVVPTSSSEWLASGALPGGIARDLEVLVRDESGTALGLAEFVEAYRGQGLGELVPDGDGVYRFDVELVSSYVRGRDGLAEPSRPDLVPEGVPRWRSGSCPQEEDWDRFQRATIDNLTTGESWSVDLDNPWPDEEPGAEPGDGRATVEGVRARRGDRLQVRYNVRAVGYVPVLGGGLAIVDLNRFWRSPESGTSPDQCGRRLGTYQGASIDYPACVGPEQRQEGLLGVATVAVHGETGCDGPWGCRGTGRLDVYTPLNRVGLFQSAAPDVQPGGLQSVHAAACIDEVGGEYAVLTGVELANDVEWIDHGVRGSLAGVVDPPTPQEPVVRRGDLLFLAMGNAGIFVFDVSDRLADAPGIVGHLKTPDRGVTRLQFDATRGLLFVGGYPDTIEVWDVRHVNVGPDTSHPPTPVLVLDDVRWTGEGLGVDASGTGLLATWSGADGPQLVPFERPRLRFHGVFRGDSEERPTPSGQRPPSVLAPTRTLVPLGVPATLDVDDEALAQADRESTAAFKVRLALPGSFGERLTARVESLRVLPDERYLGREDVGGAVALPGGAGWPDRSVTVTLKRLGSDAADDALGGSGVFSTAYNLYESEETVLLVADPRARREAGRQDAPSTESDEEGVCRRCDYPPHLPDPSSPSPALADVRELLAGRYVRAYLAEDPSVPGTVVATRRALEFFEAQGDNYPAPAGWAEVLGAADALPSPLQLDLAEPPRYPATFSAGEAGASVSLVGGEALVESVDHRVGGRSLPFVVDRSYRSGWLGYGPLGAAGWTSSLFTHLRELPTTGEVELYDGAGRVWRLVPADVEVPEGYREDDSGSYHVPDGLDLRVQKLFGGGGWRVLGRHRDVARFDSAGRLVERSDRYRQGAEGGERGSTLRYHYDAFGQLAEVEDDLGRRYRFRYHDEDPEDPRYGLLERIEDFAGRSVEYEWSEDRELERVLLPEVHNPVSAFSELSYTGADRPAVEYEYGAGTMLGLGAVLGGSDWSPLRLAAVRLPDFTASGVQAPRLRIEYAAATGRVTTLGFPDPDGFNSPGAGIEWELEYGDAAGHAGPATEAVVVAPWGHRSTRDLEHGRTVAEREQLEVATADGVVEVQTVERRIAYSGDGRMLRVEHPDGAVEESCYPDGANEAEECGAGADGIDPLSLANVVRSVTRATTDEGRGSATYAVLSSAATYDSDNLPSSVVDGESRRVDVAVPQAGVTASTVFRAEGVGRRHTFDAYGRASEVVGLGDGGAAVHFGYDEDARGRAAAGYLESIDFGGGFGVDLERDDRGNVTVERSSQGGRTERTYDTWDRVVAETSGESEGALAGVGAATCGDQAGSRVERGYDPAGHLVRERHLQDHVDSAGALGCRWVESRYTYDAGERLVSVEQSHLASPGSPGAVTAGLVETVRFVYDQHGRLARRVVRNVESPDLVTRTFYDPAGRVSRVQVGTSAPATRAYDVRSRVVLSIDGDEAVSRTRWDAWNRPWHQTSPTGAVTVRHYDRTHQPTRETVFDRDPTADSGAVVLADAAFVVTSFGEVERLVEDIGTLDERELRVTERVFDESGREIGVYSGPPTEATADLDLPLVRLDADRARREVERQYELDTGRVLRERFGGLFGGRAETGVDLVYGDVASPWPVETRSLESVPGEEDLVQTAVERLIRDVWGRVVVAEGNDGSKIETTWARDGGVLRTRTGADRVESVVTDARGAVLAHLRPLGRGSTTYRLDRDGRVLEEVVATEGDPWTRAMTYDATGRLGSITHPDGSTEGWTYTADSLVWFHTTRDGVEVEHVYDAANRLVARIPRTAEGEVLDPSLRLDAGDEIDWDVLSRPTETRRGRACLAELDADLRIETAGYDLGSRPSTETVGSRTPLGWRWDTWSRPTRTTLPAMARAGTFEGYSRSWDTLDRVSQIGEIGSYGSRPLGAGWTWGGAGRLYAMDLATGTAMRLGYLGGRGPELPAGPEPGADSQWRLGSLVWGRGDAGALAAPTETWGAFGYGWRGGDGEPSDGAKLGRVVGGMPDELGALAGMGWSYGYDAAVRLSVAEAGKGSIQGRAPPEDEESFRYEYGAGDELESAVREETGEVATYETGADGRPLARDGVAYEYDRSGRRVLDDRHSYRWSWRGELVEVLVAEAEPPAEGEDNPGATPYAGHRIEYRYDAAGRLTTRLHEGLEPAGGGARPFVERREYVWDGETLVAEVGYGDPEAAQQPRWRKTYVPGPSGLDDAVQVAVEVLQPGSPVSGQRRVYSYLRDELGSVVGLVAEDEAVPGEAPPVPVRYLYDPYGQAHAETAPEPRWARFEGGGDIGDRAGGSLKVRWSLPLEAATLGAVEVERLEPGAGWQAWPEAGVALVGEGAEIEVLPADGWERGRSYRVRVPAAVGGAGGVRDVLGRSIAEDLVLEWSVPGEPGGVVSFEKRWPVVYGSAAAASERLGGLFPGGQTALYTGLWTDPVTGMSYARARWLDTRDAGWLSQDPLQDIDSTNLYAYVGWQPNMAVDNEGELAFLVPFAVAGATSVVAGAGIEFLRSRAMDDEFDYSYKDAAIDFGLGFATSGLSSLGKLRHVKKLGTAGRAALRVGGEIGLDVGAEAIRQQWKHPDQDLDLDQLLRGAATNFVIGEVGSKVTRKLGIGRRVQSWLGGEGCSGRKKCFGAGTLVATLDGPKPVEEIEPGDWVWAFDERTGEVNAAEVLRTFERAAPDYFRLTVGLEVLEVTAEHPFFVVGRGWTPAEELEPGDWLLALGDVAEAVVAIERVQSEKRVYNFEVAGLHSYFVGVEQLLVHNCRGSSPSRQNRLALPQTSSYTDASFAKGGRGSSSVIDDLTEMIRYETSAAHADVTAGLPPVGAWTALYSRGRNSASLPKFIKRLWHGNAVQELANDRIRKRMLSDARYSRFLASGAFKFNKGGIWRRLRPDFQLALPSGNISVWDISTSWGKRKILKYDDARVQYLINVTHQGI